MARAGDGRGRVGALNKRHQDPHTPRPMICVDHTLMLTWALEVADDSVVYRTRDGK